MGGSGNTTTTEIRYAPYLESAHSDALVATDSAVSILNLAWTDSMAGQRPVDPYNSYTDLDVDDVFFGIGIAMTSFPSLYKKFGDLMTDIDIETLYNTIFDDSMNGPVITNIIAQEAVELSDELETNSYPRYEIGMRDANAVMTSSYVIGKALMEVGKTKALAKFGAEIKSRMLAVASERWKTHLDWNRQVVEMNAQIMKFYFMAKHETDTYNREVHLKHLLWPFTTTRYILDALGVLNNAVNQKSSTEGAGTATRVLGGAMMGLSAGATAFPGSNLGIGLGGAIGAAAGALSH
jgi:hypothetical protein